MFNINYSIKLNSAFGLIRILSDFIVINQFCRDTLAL